jgi:hypothetical protein
VARLQAEGKIGLSLPAGRVCGCAGGGPPAP